MDVSVKFPDGDTISHKLIKNFSHNLNVETFITLEELGLNLNQKDQYGN